MSGHLYKGSCLCGQIGYQVVNVGLKMAHCHCSDCRKFHGAAFSTFAEASLHDFSWTRGEELLSQFQADNGSVRQFCRHCGSSLTFQPKVHNGLIEFALATLDTQGDFQPDAHIFMDSKVDWYSPQDGLPTWPKHRSE